MISAVLLLAAIVGSGLAAIRQAGTVGLSSGRPPPATTPLATPTRDPSVSPSPRETPPGTIASPSIAARPRWLAVTAADVAKNIRTDPFVTETFRDISTPGSPVFNSTASFPTLGEPVFVRALVPTSPPIWLVPVVSAGKVVGIFGAKLAADGTAAAEEYSGWSGQFPHALSVAEVTARGSAPGDSVISAEIVWATVSPMEGGPGTELYPFYRLVRASGSVWYVFQNGNVVAADTVHPLD